MVRTFNQFGRVVVFPDVLAALAAFSSPSSALPPLITDDTGTQGAGGNQLEVSYNRDRTRVAGETERVQSVPVVYTYGLTLAIGYIRTTDAESPKSKTDSVTAGLTWRFR